MLNQEFIQKIKARLIKEKAEVQEKINKFSEAPEPADNSERDDIAQQSSDRALRETLLASHQEILGKINQALARIEKGVYGKCEKCDTEISEADLEKDPWAEHCGHCHA